MPYCVQLRRDESPPVTSMLEDGFWYTHPERQETAIVWAKDASAIAEVLEYHYPRSWSHLTIIPDHRQP